MKCVLQALCESIRAELENDRLIAETGVYPPHVDLPLVTAPEYCHVSIPACCLGAMLQMTSLCSKVCTCYCYCFLGIIGRPSRIQIWLENMQEH